MTLNYGPDGKPLSERDSLTVASLKEDLLVVLLMRMAAEGINDIAITLGEINEASANAVIQIAMKEDGVIRINFRKRQ
jgi:hypothetical protein